MMEPDHDHHRLADQVVDSPVSSIGKAGVWCVVPELEAVRRERLIHSGLLLTDTPGKMSTAGDNAYLRDAVLTATPEQLQLMLYDGAIRKAMLARDAIERGDFETSFDQLTKAQHIINEMQMGLNYEVNAELCRSVAAIYNFIYRKLVDANVQRDVNAIDDALRVLRIERETWQILVDKVNRVRESGESGSYQFPAANTPVGAGISIEG